MYLNRVQFETRRFQFRSSPPWATLEGWYYGFQTGRGLDIRASRHPRYTGRRGPPRARSLVLAGANKPTSTGADPCPRRAACFLGGRLVRVVWVSMFVDGKWTAERLLLSTDPSHPA